MMSSSTRWRTSLSVIARVDVAVQGGSLAVFRLGDPNPVRAPAKVLAVHGITANSRAWLAVARRLEGRAELLVPDLRGRGASNALGPPYGMGAHARDMLAVLERWAERGAAPERILATKFQDDDPHRGVLRTRPLCAYPRAAHYLGAGSSDDARNYSCLLPGP